MLNLGSVTSRMQSKGDMGMELLDLRWDMHITFVRSQDSVQETWWKEECVPKELHLHHSYVTIYILRHLSEPREEEQVALLKVPTSSRPT